MKIIGYTCVYNEEGFIPYVMPYVEAFGYDKFIVYDNGSTDRTVEMLSKYPFVEIRPWDTHGKFDDNEKAILQREAFKECKRIANIDTDNEEAVWMTFTDFDEVLFYNGDIPIKAALQEDHLWRGYNCFYKNMINLFPPKSGSKTDFRLSVENSRPLVHGMEGVRGNYWVGGAKPTLIYVNDFDNIDFFPGNHYAYCTLREGTREVKNYADCCRLYGFHLKFIDEAALYKKWCDYAMRGKKVYLENIQKFDEIYTAQESISFNMPDYFLADGMRSKLENNTYEYSGLIERK